MDIVPLFSKPVYVNDLTLDTTNIIKNLNEKFDVSGYKNETDGAFDTCDASVNKFVLNNKKYKNLKQIVEKEFEKYSVNILHYTNKFKITTSWFTRSKPNQESNYHNHNNCMFSGVLYLAANENSGGINFLNFENHRFLLPAKQYNVFNGKNHTFDAKPGRILFFPSELHHKILKNKSSEDRYSLAFNFIPVGDIGDVSEDSQIKGMNINDG